MKGAQYAKKKKKILKDAKTLLYDSNPQLMRKC